MEVALAACGRRWRCGRRRRRRRCPRLHRWRSRQRAATDQHDRSKPESNHRHTPVLEQAQWPYRAWQGARVRRCERARARGAKCENAGAVRYVFRGQARIRDQRRPPSHARTFAPRTLTRRSVLVRAEFLFGVLDVGAVGARHVLGQRDGSRVPLGSSACGSPQESASTAPFLKSSSIRRSARGSMSLSLARCGRFNGERYTADSTPGRGPRSSVVFMTEPLMTERAPAAVYPAGHARRRSATPFGDCAGPHCLPPASPRLSASGWASSAPPSPSSTRTCSSPSTCPTRTPCTAQLGYG